MCGIAGIFNFGRREENDALAIARMTLRIRHRGPDDEGYLLFDSRGGYRSFRGKDTIDPDSLDTGITVVPTSDISSGGDFGSMLAFGHRRLSIVDLSPTGHQPMCSQDKRYFVVYNGEIYNFREIALELSKSGAEFHGTSDTEVLLNAYAKWKEQCVLRFNGMFAFAIWDNVERTLFCARDRVGIKPFYYLDDGSRFVFASEIKSIIASGLYKPEPDFDGLRLSLAFGHSARPGTSFRGIRSLEQAHYMFATPDGVKAPSRYWSIPTNVQDHSLSEKDCVELLEEKLIESVKRRLVADVPVGTFMSGGVDSTTVSAVAAKLHPRIKAFTLAFTGLAPEFDELPEAIATARMCNIDHVIWQVDPEKSLSRMQDWIDSYEEPYYGLSPNLIISKLVMENDVKVVLSGLGGDELFAGYGWYNWIRPRRYARMFRPLTSLYFHLKRPKYDKLAAFSRITDPADAHTFLYSRFSDGDLDSIFSEDAGVTFSVVERVHDLYCKNRTYADDVDAMNYMDMINYIGNHHVHRADLQTMFHSIECRFPMLDHELVEAAFRIPSKFKLKGKTQKYVLRKVASKYVAPECLAMKKKGFSLPLHRWIRNELKDLVREKMTALMQRPFVRAKTIERYYESYKENKVSPEIMWSLITLEMWYERFIEGRDI
ncbi:MAG: asparagine synthase (glutamine-hydrolyzing) [Planctomycetes bacterium]|nr:asparagine synthase (glutamine-hydrolyzing) [Planctomycetota bacterium]